jgi:hypothetical protein
MIKNENGKVKRMHILKVFIFLCLLSFLGLYTYAQDAYAPWVELKQDIPDGMKDSYENMKLNTPDKNMVELPAYPGAKIIETSQSTQSVNESEVPNLPTVTLISSDPAEKVIKVYKDIITDFPQWHWDANLKIFYKGDLRKSLNGHSPYIQVTPIQTDEPDLIYVSPKELEVANSKIVVCYNPGNVTEN